jgi:fumarate hydratase class II
MLIQVCAQVIGNDACITFSGTAGALELNTMLPVTAYNLLQSVTLLAAGARVFARRCVAGLEANREKCERNIEQSLAMCTALVPVLGYDRAADIAKQAYASGKTVRQVALEAGVMGEEELRKLLDPETQAGPETP